MQNFASRSCDRHVRQLGRLVGSVVNLPLRKQINLVDYFFLKYVFNHVLI